MLRQSTPYSVFLALFAPALSGCMATDMLDDLSSNGSESQEQEIAEEPEPTIERSDNYEREGTEGTCDGYKFSYCDAIASCDAFSSREQCELDLGYMKCHPEAPLADCQARIDAAIDAERCQDLPPDCTPAQLADRTIPTALCMEIHEAICEYELYCGLELSVDSCMASLARTEPCDGYTSILPGAYDCADAYAILSCGDPMPQACLGALRY